MTRHIAKLMVVAGALSFGACAHQSEQAKAKSDYEAAANRRIKTMDKRIDDLQKKEGQQLPGQPKMDLTQAVNDLKQRTDSAKAELTELDKRDTNTWVDKKEAVDQKLFDMDQAYSNALQVLQAH